MDLHLGNKLALVTGSTQGIGKEVASRLLREGATVIINGRSQDRIDAAIDELGDLGKIYGVAADIATATGAEELGTAIADIGSVDILVNNVGFFEFEPFFKVTDDDWLKLFELNVMSGVRLTRALMPGMLDRNWGRIVFVASEAGVKPNPEMIHYSVTKTTQIALARGLAEMTKGTGSLLIQPSSPQPGLKEWKYF